ncbi:hypothetical protein [Salinigranum sp. GCM10025319]|uniref:hypothetical protein n=1 Tax=Salinigranum sp. GCM10025319 TaxID=3252687 RepID=UPI0036213185
MTEQLTLRGDWRLTVTKRQAAYDQRFVIDGSENANGIHQGVVGYSVVVRADGGAPWTLTLQHNDGTGWDESELRETPREVDGADITYKVESEDATDMDFTDLVLRLDSVEMVDVPFRPYAVRPSDLFQLPDGIFERALGTYYMGVRVRNVWGDSLTEDHVLDVSPASRTDLQARGIQVLDGWSAGELSRLGQRQRGRGMVLGPLNPGDATTVFFKVDVSGAAPRKHMVEFVCLDMDGTPDPSSPKRRVTRPIFVSHTYVDRTAGHVVSEVQQGRLSLDLKEVAYDQEGARDGRRRKTEDPRPSGSLPREDLRRLLEGLLDGENVDPCDIMRVLSCHCVGDEPPGDLPPGDDRFEYDPFYAVPKRYSFDVTPRQPYEGQYGPLPFDDPWWKVLLLIVAAVLFVAGMLEEGSDLAYHDEDIVIGTLSRFQADDVDAALCRLDTDRTLGFQEVLDAQSDEDHQEPIESLDAVVSLERPVMTKEEVEDILLLPLDDPDRKVFKSGARTGLTHGLINGLAPDGHDEATFSIDQLIVVSDPDFDEEVSDSGDSGSVWVHTESRRPIALNHSGNLEGDPERAIGSLLEDVEDQLGVRF